MRAPAGDSELVEHHLYRHGRQRARMPAALRGISHRIHAEQTHRARRDRRVAAAKVTIRSIWAAARPRTITSRSGRRWAINAAGEWYTDYLDTHNLWGEYLRYEQFLQGEPLTNGHYADIGSDTGAITAHQQRGHGARVGQARCDAPGAA